VKFFVWIVFSGAALAQTAAPPPGTAPPPAAAAPPPAKPVETFQSAMEKQRASIALQRETVRKQMGMAVRLQEEPSGEDSPSWDCPAIADPELTPMIENAARLHQVEPKLIRGVIEQESAFHACAISSKGAKGLMQLMPATIEQFNVTDAFDPEQNIEAGATYLRQLMDKYKGDLKLVLAAYNSGPTTVDKTGGIPDIKETQDYVEGVLKKVR
jgi:soluble lytic murein transglycosylase-like protein